MFWSTLKSANARYFASLKKVETVTDDWMDTEAAALARDKMAAESKARKMAEAEEIRRENAAMKKRLSEVKALTDDDISECVPATGHWAPGRGGGRGGANGQEGERDGEGGGDS